ncbi:hypothetical protein [Streptomyces tibetensis]|uniref:hypothetical protein n=1 Tax=Streptomyces tibetensis TaxID=2382123 RepID=UPI003F4CB28F
MLPVDLVLNATAGWSWANPIAALVIAAIAIEEGRDAWQGKGCCAPAAHPAPGPAAEVLIGRLRLPPRPDTAEPSRAAGLAVLALTVGMVGGI